VLSKWIYQFQDFLLQKVIADVTELSDFINFTDKALDMEVVDQDSMLQVMGYLRDIRKRTEGTDNMFEPLRQIVTLLTKHNVSTPPEIVNSLEQVPITWSNVKKKAMLTKDKHSKEQSTQAEKLKRQSKDFEFRVEEFYNHFKRAVPSEYSSNFEKAYEIIDHIHHENNKEDPLPFGTLMDLRRDAARLNEMQELFELYVGLQMLFVL
jgi:dynein heavy chain